MKVTSTIALHLTLNISETVRDRGLVPKDHHCIGLCSVLRPLQHSIGYMGDGFYRSKDPTNSIKVLKENLQRQIKQRKQHKTDMHRQ